MFFRDRYLIDEVKYLREQNKNLLNIIVALNNKSSEINLINNKEAELSEIDRIKKDIEMKATLTDEDKKHKDLAQRQLKELLS